jgi:glycosyltransferase involved in cell wall biosynthesis
MKVLFLAEYYPPYILGGAEICGEKVVNKLVEKGITVYVLTPNCETNEEIIQVVNNNYTIHRFPSIKRFSYKKGSREASAEVYQKSSGLFYLLLNQVIKLFNIEMYWQAKKILNRYTDFDVVQSNNIETMEVLSKLDINESKFSFIRDLGVLGLNYRTYKGQYTDRCGVKELVEYYETNKIFAWLIKKDIVDRRKKELKKIEFFVTINDYVREQMIHDGFSEHRIFTVKDPIDLTETALTKSEARKKHNIVDSFNVVLFIGSLTKVKGAHLLPMIAAQLPHIEFIIAGDGPLANDFKAININNFHYIGKRNSNDIKELMRASDLLLLPQTVHYGIGLVALEAMYSGLPILSSNVNGIQEYIKHDETGYVVEKNDVASYVEAIKYLMENKLKLKYYSREGSMLVRKDLDLDKNINELIMRYNGSTW